MTLDRSRLFAMVDRMPTFSQSVVRILELTADINTAPKDLVRLVEHDPILTMKVLKLVNSAYFGLSRPVTSIKQGVVYLGVNTLKHLAISIAAIGALPRHNDAGFDMDAFWSHSLVTAAVAKLLAQERGVPKGDATRFFIAGLLHDIGQVVFAQFMPAEYRAVMARVQAGGESLVAVEEALIGSSHAEVGAVLGAHWKLPEEFVEAIRGHHAPTAPQTPIAMDAIVCVANQVAKLIDPDSAPAGTDAALPAPILDWLGMPLAEVPERLTGLAAEIENAHSFIHVPTESGA